MVYLVTYNDGGKKIVSHGVDTTTKEKIQLPNVSVECIPCYFSEKLKKYILKEAFA